MMSTTNEEFLINENLMLKKELELMEQLKIAAEERVSLNEQLYRQQRSRRQLPRPLPPILQGILNKRQEKRESESAKDSDDPRDDEPIVERDPFLDLFSANEDTDESGEDSDEHVFSMAEELDRRQPGAGDAFRAVRDARTGLIKNNFIKK